MIPRVPCLMAFCVASMLSVQSLSAQRGDGYVRIGDRILVNRSSHWNNWTLPAHAVRVSGDGVSPIRFRYRYNVLDDLETFSRRLTELSRRSKETAILNLDSTETVDVHGNVVTKKKSGVEIPLYTYLVRMGISRVGSNGSLAGNILDGDPETYWEPDPSDALDDWWVEVDLGRAVAVDSVVVRFVDQELGDPFRQFRLLAAPNQVATVENARKVDFEVVGRTTSPNREQRQFDFPLSEGTRRRGANPDWTGKLTETLRIVVTETKAGRGRLITEVEWEALEASDRGDILYFVKVREDFEEPVEQAVYEGLPSERQGRRDHYIRERPRLADIEVWGWGNNLSPGIAGGGGLVLSGGGFSPSAGFDGDFATAFIHPYREKTAIVDRGVLTVDLGAAFWVDEMRISVAGSRNIDGYSIRGSNGTLDTNGQLKWQRLSAREREDNSVDLYRSLLEAFNVDQPLRFLEMITIDHGLNRFRAGPNIAEYQLFTEGYPAEVVLTSDLIELPAGRNLGRIEWEAETPAGTQLEIRSRSGNQRQKDIRYYNKTGGQVKASSTLSAQAVYNNLFTNRGAIDTVFVVGSDWSSWSRSYTQSGEQLTSPSQKALMQLQVTLRTEDRFSAASISRVIIELVDPVVESLVAELWPLEIAAPGRVDTFEVFVRPFLVERPFQSRSFDEMVMRLGGADMELLEMDVGFGEESVQSFRPTLSGDFLSEDGEPLTLLSTGADSIHLRLPPSLGVQPTADGQRLYYRVTVEEDEVPVGRDGQLLTLASYGLLEPEERGSRLFFEKETDASGQERLTSVEESEYDELGEGERAARYFRILLDEGGQYPFSATGDTLDATGYGSLSSSSRGRVVGTGPLMRVVFAAPVFVNGTTLEMAVRNTFGGTDLDEPWQAIEPGDATGLVSSEALSIQLPLDVQLLDNVTISPNPFTPNGDRVNDETRIDFQVFKLSATREVSVRIFTLDGRRVWERAQMVDSGTASIAWTGLDRDDKPVPPGIYICQLELNVDDDNADTTTLSKLVHVVY